MKKLLLLLLIPGCCQAPIYPTIKVYPRIEIENRITLDEAMKYYQSGEWKTGKVLIHWKNHE